MDWGEAQQDGYPKELFDDITDGSAEVTVANYLKYQATVRKKVYAGQKAERVATGTGSSKPHEEMAAPWYPRPAYQALLRRAHTVSRTRPTGIRLTHSRSHHPIFMLPPLCPPLPRRACGMHLCTRNARSNRPRTPPLAFQVRGRASVADGCPDRSELNPGQLHHPSEPPRPI